MAASCKSPKKSGLMASRELNLYSGRPFPCEIPTVRKKQNQCVEPTHNPSRFSLFVCIHKVTLLFLRGSRRRSLHTIAPSLSAIVCALHFKASQAPTADHFAVMGECQIVATGLREKPPLMQPEEFAQNIANNRLERYAVRRSNLESKVLVSVFHSSILSSPPRGS